MGAILPTRTGSSRLNHESTPAGTGSFPHLWNLERFTVRALSIKSSSVAMKAHNFEPSPDNFKRLCAATCDVSNVRLSLAAVGERSGKPELLSFGQVKRRSLALGV
jgi:hypothetical protein